jgi:S-adenosylmethionine:tRNA ribosyltransferase-isomerase
MSARAQAVPRRLLGAGPIERRGGARDESRLLTVAGDRVPVDGTMRDLPRHLRFGDLLVVNLSATLPAAIDAGGLTVHLATPLPDGDWLVEVRRPCRAGTVPYGVEPADRELAAAGGGRIVLREPAARRADGAVRLWRARVELRGGVERHLAGHGRPIRYGCAAERWPIEDYQTVFAAMPGSAEMPSAARGFTGRLLAELAAAGVGLAPIVLHTGVSSPEAGEPPFPERYWVPAATARRVNAVRRRGGRVVAVGTTAVRALETDARDGRARPGAGWTDLVVTPERGAEVVDGLLTGWHEPEASHLLLLEAVAGRPALERAYAAARELGHLWHEFGDFNLLLPEPAARARDQRPTQVGGRFSRNAEMPSCASRASALADMTALACS